MKPEELRIGNWVESNGFWDKEGPVQISRTFISEEGNDYFKCYNPIPLTEEWLERFGFIKEMSKWVEDDFYFKKTRKGVDFVSLWSSEVIAQYDVSVVGFDVFVKYVHQLQNLYYALTGEELEIKDK